MQVWLHLRVSGAERCEKLRDGLCIRGELFALKDREASNVDSPTPRFESVHKVQQFAGCAVLCVKTDPLERQSKLLFVLRLIVSRGRLAVHTFPGGGEVAARCIGLVQKPATAERVFELLGQLVSRRAAKSGSRGNFTERNPVNQIGSNFTYDNQGSESDSTQRGCTRGHLKRKDAPKRGAALTDKCIISGLRVGLFFSFEKEPKQGQAVFSATRLGRSHELRAHLRSRVGVDYDVCSILVRIRKRLCLV